MTRRSYLIIFLLGIALAAGIASMQSVPGYLDSDYYFAGGLQLVEGRGFTEPYLWNYLDNPQGLPHPSHAYWYPLSSILSALSMFITRMHTYAGARLIFILIAGLVPVVTAALAFTMTKKAPLAWTSGLLAVFSIYHVPFMPVTDNFGPFMLLGGLYFLLMLREEKYIPLVLGFLAGLLSLARSDGLLWLGLTGLLAFWKAIATETNYPAANFNHHASRVTVCVFRFFSLALLGYLFIMLPWYARNLTVFGSPMAPGGGRILWLTNYDDTFAFPADQVNMQGWLNVGWNAALKSRLWALRMNAMNAFGAQGGILLFPFILIGLWQAKGQLRTRFAVTGWLILFAVMTLIFPFAGARGGFFHAGAAFQPFWWAVAPLGLDRITDAIRKRKWLTEHAYVIFRAALVGICVLTTGMIVWLRIIQTGWQTETEPYERVEQILTENGAQPGELVIVRNPVGYYLCTGRSAIVMPPGGVETILALAVRYDASYFVLDPEGVLDEYQALYNDLAIHPGLVFIGETEGARIYELHPTE